MNSEVMTQHDKQTVYTTQNERITISLWLYGNEWHVRRVIISTDENYSRCLDWTMLYTGKDYAAALKVYEGECATQSFIPDNPNESGQMIVLFLLAIVCIALVLYMCYSGISALCGTTSLFDTMIQSLSEVIK